MVLPEFSDFKYKAPGTPVKMPILLQWVWVGPESLHFLQVPDAAVPGSRFKQQ